MLTDQPAIAIAGSTNGTNAAAGDAPGSSDVEPAALAAATADKASSGSEHVDAEEHCVRNALAASLSVSDETPWALHAATTSAEV